VVFLLDHNGILIPDSSRYSQENEMENSYHDSGGVTFLCQLPISDERTVERRKSHGAHWRIMLIPFFLGDMLYPSNSNN